MAALAEERAAAAGLPALVDRRMGAGMALLADEAEDRPAGGCEQAARLLDRRGIDPVLGVAQAHPGIATRPEHAVRRRQRLPPHLGARRGRGAEEAGEGLLHDHVLAGPGGLHRQRRVEMVRHAQVHHVHRGIGEDRPGVGGRAARAELGGEGGRSLGPGGRHPGELHLHAVDLPVRLDMEAGHEARADHPHSHARDLVCWHQRSSRGSRRPAPGTPDVAS